MEWYFYIAWLAIISQLLLLFQIYKNYSFALQKYQRKREWYRPKVALIVPCKGLDETFTENISSFFKQDYDNYQLHFVVADKDDPAYEQLCRLKEELTGASRALDIRVCVAGRAQGCSQKIHNLLCCYREIDDDVEVLAFADSDACVRSDWLSHLVYPLRKTEKYGAASGYRWFVPEKNNPASLALSAVNAKIAQLLGNTIFNQVWGGSMAIRADVFRRLGLEQIWQKTLSDDLSISYAVKKSGLQVAFVPACLVASYESTTWSKLFEFARRQFLITRVSMPRTWWFALFSAVYSVLGLWAGTALAIYAAAINSEHLPLFIMVPITFFICQMSRAIIRQTMVSKLLKKDFQRLKAAMAVDIFLFWLWSIMLLIFVISSAFGRTIRWRGIRYKLLSPTETIVIDDDYQESHKS